MFSACSALAFAAAGARMAEAAAERGRGRPMNFSEYVKQDAVGLADRVWRREVTADELLTLALAQSERAQPKTNAICRMMETEARAKLGKPLTGAFAGVPFLIKDI